MQLLGHIIQLNIGKSVAFAKPGAKRQFNSAINKSAITETVNVTHLGIEGDEVGDPKVHGGIDKAVHIYPSEHYQFWQTQLNQNPVLDQFNAFGENIASKGVTEDTVCLGDQLSIGSCIFEVIQTRQPCWKLNVRLNHEKASTMMQQSKRTGWYLKVIQPGNINPQDQIYLKSRPHPQWPLSKIINLFYYDKLNIKALTELAKLPLVPSWQKLIERRLKTQSVEDWSARLTGV